MSVGVAQATFAATLVDEWIALGVTDAVICPGSRSTPMALALTNRPEVGLHVRLDERSAGFFALGHGLATGRPALLLVTSGTAAAELHPAVVEAHEARVPLIVLTADRPPELHHIGAPQTIDQVRLFGPAVRWFADPGVPEAGLEATWRPLAARALAEATRGPFGPGPVHVNLAFRDPLAAEPGPLPVRRSDGWRPPLAEGSAASSGPPAGWFERSGIIVAGGGSGANLEALELAERAGWPVLADPRSGLRRSGAPVVAAADALLGDAEVREALRPEAVVLMGGPWISKVVGGFLAEASVAGAEVVALDPWWRWADPERAVTTWVHDDPAAWLTAGVRQLDAVSRCPLEWMARWMAAEEAAQRAMDDVLGAGGPGTEAGALSEPLLARALFAWVPPGTTILTASSMPVRDLEWFAASRSEPPRVLANRGANGIDGVTSTALGLTTGGSGPVVALLGDLAFLHDVSGLVHLGQGAPESTCLLVVVDNAGGGIFSFLPQARLVDPGRFELLFGTPPKTDLSAVARGFGLEVAEVSTLDGLKGALLDGLDQGGVRVVRARVPDRRSNVVLHERVHEAVRAAVAAALRA